MNELREFILTPAAADLLYLVSCALHGAAPAAEQLSAMNDAAVLELAEFHMLGAMTAMALESCGFLRETSPYADAWKQLRDKAIRKNILLDAERTQLLIWFEKNNVWYAPLKGIILQRYYPRFGMRQMSDNDILYDPSFKEPLRDYMLARGYRAEEYDVTNHDEYQKAPVYNFEFHRALFRHGEDERWLEYYKNIADRLIPDGPGSCGRHFSDEDFYVYVVTHARKHFDRSGTGLRSLLDVYVYNRAKPELDRDYIRCEAEKLGTADFEQLCRELAEKLFSEPVHRNALMLTAEEAVLFEDCVAAGFCGTREKRISRTLGTLKTEGGSVTAGTKLKYLLRRLFPEREWYYSVCPWCRGREWFIPVYWLWRIVRGLTIRRKKLKNELDILKKAE